MSTQQQTEELGLSMSDTVAEEVRALLARRQIRQHQLGAVLGISQGQISSRLKGRIDFTLDELGIMAEFFGVSPASLLGLENAERPRPEPVEGDAVRHEGLEPPTRWLTALPALHADVVDLPAVAEVAGPERSGGPLADVIPFRRKAA